MLNGLIVTSVPKPDKNGDYIFQVVEEHSLNNKIVRAKYDTKIHASSVAFVPCEAGYELDIKPEVLERFGKNMIYPKFTF